MYISTDMYLCWSHIMSTVNRQLSPFPIIITIATGTQLSNPPYPADPPLATTIPSRLPGRVNFYHMRSNRVGR